MYICNVTRIPCAYCNQVCESREDAKEELDKLHKRLKKTDDYNAIEAIYKKIKYYRQLLKGGK